MIPEMRVPKQTQHCSLVGAAFDYLVRFRLSSRLQATGVDFHERTWLAETIAERIGLHCSAKDARRWKRTVSDARTEIERFDWTAGDFSKIGDIAQYLAHADILHRYPAGFDPKFVPMPEVNAELLDLFTVFEKQSDFLAKESCILNPVFEKSIDVGGADADLVIDDALIDLKVTIKGYVPLDSLMQLAGYAALQKLGGIDLGSKVYSTPFKRVGLYYARHGKLISWDMDELFQPGGFDKFCMSFAERLPDWYRSLYS